MTIWKLAQNFYKWSLELDGVSSDFSFLLVVFRHGNWMEENGRFCMHGLCVVGMRRRQTPLWPAFCDEKEVVDSLLLLLLMFRSLFLLLFAYEEKLAGDIPLHDGLATMIDALSLF